MRSARQARPFRFTRNRNTSAPPRSGRTTRSARSAFAKYDAALLEVVGGHFDLHPVAHHRPDAELPHLAGGVSDYPVVVFKHNAETTIRQDFIDLAIEGQEILLGHSIKPILD